MKKVPRKFICMIRENNCWDPGEQRVCREKEGEVKPVTARYHSDPELSALSQ